MTDTAPGPGGGQTSDSVKLMRYDANKKSPLIAYLLWFFLGMLGAHRFYLGRTGSAIAMLVLTLVAFVMMLVLIGHLLIFIPFIWMIVDAFLIPGMVRDFNNALIQRLA